MGDGTSVRVGVSVMVGVRVTVGDGLCVAVTVTVAVAVIVEVIVGVVVAVAVPVAVGSGVAAAEQPVRISPASKSKQRNLICMNKPFYILRSHYIRFRYPPAINQRSHLESCDPARAIEYN